MSNTAKYTVKCSANVEPSVKDNLRKISEDMYCTEAHIIRQALREFIARFNTREQSIEDFHNTKVTFHKDIEDA